MLFLFRSAPEVEKRIHSKLFRKFWRSRGTKEPAYITVHAFTKTHKPTCIFRPACIWIWLVFVFGLHTCESCASSSVQGKWGASECNPKWGKIPDAIFLFYRAGLPPLYFLFQALTVLVFSRLWSVWSGAWKMFCIKVALEAPLDLPHAIKVIFPMFLLRPWVGSRQTVLEYGHALV